EDDVGGFPAQFERHALQTSRRRFIDFCTCRIRTGKRDLGNAWMRDQFAADLRPETSDHVEDAIGYAGLLRQRSEFQCARGREFGWLDDDGATGGESGRTFPGNE